MKFYTIKEIARMAGVSAGTVDRVLHERGKVSPEKESKVRNILDKIDYKPNEVARSLRLNKKFRVAILLPDAQRDEYWGPGFKAIEEVQEELSKKGIFVEVKQYDPVAPDNFTELCQQTLKASPDGILLGALFEKESKAFVDQLRAAGIPFVLINALVENEKVCSFVGQDLQKSGRTAAHLLDIMLPGSKSLLVVHLAEAFENASHMQQKELGFRDYFKQFASHVDVHTLNIRTGHEHTIPQQIGDLPSTVDGIFVTTSKAYLLLRAGVKVPVVGYDLLAENVEGLKNGKIKFLIHQNLEQQVKKGIAQLSEDLLSGHQTHRQQWLPIEIIGPENVDSYLG